MKKDHIWNLIATQVFSILLLKKLNCIYTQIHTAPNFNTKHALVIAILKSALKRKIQSNETSFEGAYFRSKFGSNLELGLPHFEGICTEKIGLVLNEECPAIQMPENGINLLYSFLEPSDTQPCVLNSKSTSDVKPCNISIFSSFQLTFYPVGMTKDGFLLYMNNWIKI